MLSNHLFYCHPLIFLPSIFSSIMVFSNELVPQIRCPKYWNFSFNISPSNRLWLISFRIDWLDLFFFISSIYSLFGFIYYLLSKDNCFTEFYCFLSNLNMNQPSVQFSHSVMSDSLQPHGLQHTRPPCPSPTPGVYPNSCPLSR